ncbi:hemin-degrading factor [Providencia sp. Me31A]|uniref:hemin-degrading factor n=1 Tax=Providencia sp. Me31A TaxID=3392637 RepID=UPI003D27B90D
MNTRSYNDYLQVKAQNPEMHTRDLASLLGITEAELLYCRVSQENVQRLSNDVVKILGMLPSIGSVKAITRNDCAVIIQTGQYDNVRLHHHGGLFLNPRKLDLRMFFAQWDSIFTVTEKTKAGSRHSIQFFDKHGDALHKIYATEQTDMDAWQNIIALYSSPENSPLCLDKTSPSLEIEINAELKQQIEQQWRDMKDVHQFFTILKNNNLHRQQVFRIVSQELAWQVPTHSLSTLLAQAHQIQNEIMLFVSNRGCVQIFTGRINKPSSLIIDNTQTHWLNISNTNMNLHINENEIDECWVTRKPTKDGFVTSLEVFDKQNNQIIQMYGQRSEGTPEQIEWCKQILALPHI